MLKDQSIYINDMCKSIELIQTYVKDVDYQQFEANYEIQDAVMRRFQIIAEAARRIDDSLKSVHPEIPWNKINGLRNAVTHEYDDIDLKSIWDTIKNDLPTLLQSLYKL